MKLKFQIFFVLLASTVLAACGADAVNSNKASHPSLTMTKADAQRISSQIESVPTAKAALGQLIEKVDAAMAQKIDVPTPKDAGGGYTHEQHKRNYQLLYDAGLLSQLTDNAAYVELAKQIFFEYVELYPSLTLHPKPKEQSPGKLFWQSLNEAVWLVHVIQAYDLIYEFLSEQERSTIEDDLLRPAANFLSEGQPETFNKIHNHGTWAAAAVGMTGYVLGDSTLVKQALLGLDMSGDAGFLKQIEQLFSPDGYYTEGPYYQRYALMPFVLFARAIQVNEPERNIFEFKDRALLKAIRTTVQLSYNKLFFGINDAIKDKGIDTTELVHGIAIAYEVTNDAGLLSVAKKQNQVLLTSYGFDAAAAIEAGKTEPFEFKSMQLRDGQDGTQGALAIFRSGFADGHQALVMKNTAQGLGHGHFDKLHWLYFDNGEEIISDYGAARFLNIEAKYGGHYLPENNAWAKQTIAHNTVVLDEQSQFDANWRVAQKYAPQIAFFDVTDDVKITSASLNNAYKGTKLARTMAMVTHKSLQYPLIVDVFSVTSDQAHQYDLPLHYQGQLISHNLAFTAKDTAWEQLGEDNGYQYLWDRGRGVSPQNSDESLAQMTWLNKGRFYTHSTISGSGREFIFAQLGANDPNFNLRNESSLIHRVTAAQGHTFVSVLEQHGEYNGRAEYTIDAKTNIAGLSREVIQDIDIIKIELVNGESFSLLFTRSGTADTEHSLDVDGELIQWVGHYTLLAGDGS